MDADVASIESLTPGPPSGGGMLDVTGDERTDVSAFDVDRLLVATASAAIVAADALGLDRGIDGPARRLDRAQVWTTCTTPAVVDGAPVPAWAELSGVYPTADGRRLQLHCNFAHHAAGVVAHLGVAPHRDAVAEAIARRDAIDLETELIEAGMIAAAVRTLDEWDAHPHAVATAGLPLVSVTRLGDGEPWADRRVASPHSGGGPGGLGDDDDSSGGPEDAPLRGLRVLDSSRVLAGPVGTQLLGGLGADVLRVGAAHLPHVPVGVIATGAGKRNAYVDLRTGEGRARFGELLTSADVWIDAYRPGALARWGFDVTTLAERAPGLVIVQISAFDRIGPWADRRGFDSIVQSTTGIRWAGGRWARGDGSDGDGDEPRGLPVQALDYATGFLAAQVASRLVRHQRREGGTWLAELSLRRTRDHLVALGGPRPYRPTTFEADPAWLRGWVSELGALTVAEPLAGRWSGPPRALGSSLPAWAVASEDPPGRHR